LRTGFPHSEICGSTGASPSSQLIAACYVLHRLRTPRHPPDALALTLDRSALVSHARRRTQDMERDHWIEILRSTGVQTGQSRLHYVREQNAGQGLNDRCHAFQLCLFRRRTMAIDQTTNDPRLWWSRSGSNRRPQACKARALPTELRPPGQQHQRSALKWWARDELNVRPHAYQACALTT
jgi:hypothetical protein